MNEKPLINLQFLGYDGQTVSLIGTDFTVTEAVRYKFQPVDPIKGENKGLFGGTKTVFVKQDDKKVRKIYHDALDIQGGALSARYESGSYQTTYTASNLTFGQYADALTKALEAQASRPVVVVDLISVQKANLAAKSIPT